MSRRDEFIDLCKWMQYSPRTLSVVLTGYLEDQTEPLPVAKVRAVLSRQRSLPDGWLLALKEHFVEMLFDAQHASEALSSGPIQCETIMPEFDRLFMRLVQVCSLVDVAMEASFSSDDPSS